MSGALIIVVIVSILVCAIAPWLFTRPAIFASLDFSDKGQIGDTIGGITSPFIGLISITLLIYTLLEQISFNKQQAKDNTFSQIVNTQSEILQMDGRFAFEYMENGVEKTGRSIASMAPLSISDSNNYSYTINIQQSRLLLMQLSLFVALCRCYSDLVKKEIDIEDSQSSFLDSYKQTLSEFLECVINKDIIKGNLLDNASDCQYVSEIDDIKQNAREILKSVNKL